MTQMVAKPEILSYRLIDESAQTPMVATIAKSFLKAAFLVRSLRQPLQRMSCCILNHHL
jgi:hypothetical protein